MEFCALTAISPLDGRYHEKLADLQPLFSEYALIKFRIIIEIRWLLTLSEHGRLAELPKLSKHAKNLLENIIESFSVTDATRVKHIEDVIKHDVKAVEYFLKERIENNTELAAIQEFIHFGCTSEDINNLSYSLMLQSARQQIILPTLDEILDVLTFMAHTHAAQPMLAHTHGQPATPTTIGKELANVIARLKRQKTQMVQTEILGKLNGASGNYNALSLAYPELDWQLFSKNFISSLGLLWNPYTTQIEPHDCIAEFFHVLIRINNILIDFSRDMWGYISLNYFSQKTIHNEVGSSIMPHKVNPIDFENAEGNLGIANALLEHMASKLPISRWQRDLSDSTVLRNMGVAISHSALAWNSILRGIARVEPNLTKLNHDLEQHWEILTEPVQTLLRSHGVKDAYEKLKNFSRGKKVTKEILHEFIASLPLPDAAKTKLIELTPQNYLGYAEDLAKRI